MSEALAAEIKAFGVRNYEVWKSSASPEQKAFGDADLKRFETDPAHAEREHNAMVSDWEKAGGANGNRLNQAQYTAFFKSIQERGAARGNWEDTRPEYYVESYSLAEKVNPKESGVTLVEFLAMSEIVVGTLFECRGADA